jgi:hypothetical protein
VYSTLDIGAAGSLEVIVRTDFACLDRSNEENSDALANPQAAARLLIEAGILRGATPLSPQHESQKTRVLPEIATRLAEHLSAYAA